MELTEQYFITSIAYIERLYAKKLESTVFDIYRQMFLSWTQEQWDASVKEIIKSFIPTSTVPFPLPPHFIQAVAQDNKSRAIHIITKLKRACEQYGKYESVNFGDSALHSTINRYGGCVAICNWEQKDWDMHERNFIAAYETEIRMESNRNIISLIGMIDRANAGTNDEHKRKTIWLGEGEEPKAIK